MSDIYLGDATAIDLLDEIRRDNPEAAIILVTAQGTRGDRRRGDRGRGLRLPGQAVRARAAGGAGASGACAPSATAAGDDRIRPRVDDHRQPPAHRRGLQGGGPGGAAAGAGADHRGDRHRQGAGGARPASLRRQPRRALRRHQLRRDPGDPARERALRPPPGSLHRCRSRPPRRHRVGPRRDRVPGRGGRAARRCSRSSCCASSRTARSARSGPSASVEVPARVVAATNRDLRREVDRRVLPRGLLLPARRLRDRAAAAARARRATSRCWWSTFAGAPSTGSASTSFAASSASSIDLLREYPWPGNVRELENVVQRAAVDLGSLPRRRRRSSRLLPPADHGAPATGPAIGDDLTLEELERLHIEAVLTRCGGNRTRAAEDPRHRAQVPVPQGRPPRHRTGLKIED